MRCVATLAAVAALAGCAGAPVSPPFVPADPAAITSWSASGRLALSANGEGGSGSFTWEQHSASTSLSLRGPLGSGALLVTAQDDALSVTDSDGRRLDDAQTRALLQQRLGADLPWTDLRYWMLGIPAPGEPAGVSDTSQAPLRVIEQAGWRIAYDAFGRSAGVSLPTQFTASQGSVRLKVRVDRWQVAAAAGHAP